MDEKQLHLFGVDEGKNTKKRYTVILPLDTLILLLIVAVLLFTLSFSLGVERGRKIVYLNADDKVKNVSLDEALTNGTVMALAFKNSTVATALSTPASGGVGEVVVPVDQKPAETISVVKIEKKETAKSGNVKRGIPRASARGARYVIQVASYSGEDSANREARKLANKGYPVYVEKKGKYVVVFVGDFQSKQEAQRNAKLLGQTYGPCVVRTLS
ncbi:MAG: SPOR domain-containing protein [Candidatus Omnitrophota bacterium]|nr:SPOR domain-containing protein [Candidatus Omnitrophota bacterium]